MRPPASTPPFRVRRPEGDETAVRRRWHHYIREREQRLWQRLGCRCRAAPPRRLAQRAPPVHADRRGVGGGLHVVVDHPARVEGIALGRQYQGSRAGLRLGPGQRGAQERPQEVLVDGLRHLAEGLVGLLLVLHQRVAVPHGAQADAALQVVHLMEVADPRRVDDAQHHQLLQLLHRSDGSAFLPLQPFLIRTEYKRRILLRKLYQLLLRPLLRNPKMHPVPSPSGEPLFDHFHILDRILQHQLRRNIRRTGIELFDKTG